MLFKKKRKITTTPLHKRIFNKIVVENCDKIKEKTFISCELWVNLFYILIVWGLSRKVVSGNILYIITGLTTVFVSLRKYVM